jgi:hypothetical protein
LTRYRQQQYRDGSPVLQQVRVDLLALPNRGVPACAMPNGVFV